MPQRSPSWRSAARWLGLLIFPLLPGCLIPYGFPTLSHVPGVELEQEAAPVHAFRVEITREWVDIGGDDAWTLTEMPLGISGSVPSETRLSATYGFLVFGIALNYPVYTSHTVALRLYRPGYELVEIDSWQLAAKIAWREAPDLEAQERVLDRLYPLGSETPEYCFVGFLSRRLNPGSKSEAHREVLLFGASEYERLATSARSTLSNPEDLCKRLAEKAKTLHTLAAR
jgi:hypothetical protein